MLSKHNSIQRDQLEMITLDQLVPANHLRLPLTSLSFMTW
ncbi:hypothetical protein QFZ73_005273 [Peribacillus sp. V2I11]|nr:hypothetical protein [Peribacillus sp. V2I11]